MLNTCDRRIAIGATLNNNQLPENGGTAACTFICLKIAKKCLELQPVFDEETAGAFIYTTLSTSRWIYVEQYSLSHSGDFLDELKTL